MNKMKRELETRLKRQSMWLRDSLLWLLKEKIISADGRSDHALRALDVGCGPGFTMDLFRPLAQVKGVDLDKDMVSACQLRGLDVTLGTAEELPFEDGSFDLVYCSFLLLWVKNPLTAVNEMKRVSSRWVVCFAEPDYGGRLDYPAQLSDLAELVADDLRNDGGDPFIGRRLRSLYSQAGMTAELGVHMGIWDMDKLLEESEEELKWLGGGASATRLAEKLEALRAAQNEAHRTGSLFQFNPIFYAIGRKNP
jgi:SAM-dependent methyltransferase